MVEFRPLFVGEIPHLGRVVVPRLAKGTDLTVVVPPVDAPLVGLLEAAALGPLPPVTDRAVLLEGDLRLPLPPLADLDAAPDPVVPARLVVPARRLVLGRLAAWISTFASLCAYCVPYHPSWC